MEIKVDDLRARIQQVKAEHERHLAAANACAGVLGELEKWVKVAEEPEPVEVEETSDV